MNEGVILFNTYTNSETNCWIVFSFLSDRDIKRKNTNQFMYCHVIIYLSYEIRHFKLSNYYKFGKLILFFFFFCCNFPEIFDKISYISFAQYVRKLVSIPDSTFFLLFVNNTHATNAIIKITILTLICCVLIPLFPLKHAYF